MPKEDFKPGQTKELDPNAADTEALTTFYETLYEQRPDSEMAARWLLQHGLLPEDDIAKVLKKYGKGGSANSSSKGGSKSSGGSGSQKAKKASVVAHPCQLSLTCLSTPRFTSLPTARLPAVSMLTECPAPHRSQPAANDEDDFTSKPAKKAPAKKAPAKKAPPKKTAAPDSSDEEFEAKAAAKKAPAKAPPAKKKPVVQADDSSEDDEPLQKKVKK